MIAFTVAQHAQTTCYDHLIIVCVRVCVFAYLCKFFGMHFETDGWMDANVFSFALPLVFHRWGAVKWTVKLQNDRELWTRSNILVPFYWLSLFIFFSSYKNWVDIFAIKIMIFSATTTTTANLMRFLLQMCDVVWNDLALCWICFVE